MIRMPSQKKESYIVGLGNTGEEYAHTRHNMGRDVVMLFAKQQGFEDFEFDKYTNALVTRGKIGSQKVVLVLPETYVNNSGDALKKLKLAKKDIETSLLVVQDDLDLPVGTMKIVYNRGSGGHKGVESIMHAAKTEKFARIRIGIAKPTHIKKSQNKKEVTKIVIGKFTPTEQPLIKKIIKKAAQAIEAFASNGIERAMNEFN